MSLGGFIGEDTLAMGAFDGCHVLASGVNVALRCILWRVGTGEMNTFLSSRAKSLLFLFLITNKRRLFLEIFYFQMCCRR